MDTWISQLLKSHESMMLYTTKALGRTSLVVGEKPLIVVQDKQTGSEEPHTYGEFEQVLAFRDVIIRINTKMKLSY